MDGLFAPIALRESAGEAHYAIALDVEEPYLDDHRPGGHPLFSTVMGIEALAEAARRCSGEGMTPRLREVCVLKPYIAIAPGPHAVEAVIRVPAGPRDASNARFDCSLGSVEPSGAVTEHLRAHVEFAAPARAPLLATSKHREAVGPPPTRRTVGADEVYRLFFHGPAFRVIAGAQYRDARMQCRLAPGLPPIHRGWPGPSEMAPRLIEFALQSAGLLELAASGRMMIPHSISAIERFLPIDVDHQGAIFATAGFDAEDPAAVNIDVADAQGRGILHVVRYRTEPLPFAVNAVAADRLRELLLATAP